ncbi:sensor histidine kinase [Devosia submarina]|uniref:sensor histidine kinase n=1 Tax=Devosia submarina TaxID=1173082 RepID=UPI000D36C162|nr:HAMP domain-containing sensor histidine kinase [Devosia submarina]
MAAKDSILDFIDSFIPASAKAERWELGQARNFVFTHFLGPALAQTMSVYLYLVDTEPSWQKWVVICLICSFFVMPLILRRSGNLKLVALLSFQVLTFASLFGAYHYGGVVSPFVPWVIVALMLGFFYLSEHALGVIALFAANLVGFGIATMVWGLSSRLPISTLTPLSYVSIMSATIYMAWMANYYAGIVSSRSETEREAERHRNTALRLRETKELAEKASTSKSIFLAKMSHELRTPLNAVIGYSEILLEDAEMEGKGDQTLADLKRINAAGRHLLSLVDDVLDLSKIETSTMELEASAFDLRSFVDDVISNAQPLITQNGNRLEIETSGRLGSVRNDATKLRQVALNLLSNAAKFTQDGIITFTVRRDSKVGGDWIEISVRDTGIGMSEADQAKLFQNFAQLTESTSSKYGGTGLGLALSQKLCAMMGGAISVRSEPGKGALFTARVPADVTIAQSPFIGEAGDELEYPHPMATAS